MKRFALLALTAPLALLAACGGTTQPAETPAAPAPSVTQTTDAPAAPSTSDAIVFAVLIIVLIVKPAGLLGKIVPEKV